MANGRWLISSLSASYPRLFRCSHGVSLSGGKATKSSLLAVAAGALMPGVAINCGWQTGSQMVRFPHHLDYLDLSHNSIKGRVAKSLKDINHRFFNVNYNELCGEILTGRMLLASGLVQPKFLNVQQIRW